MSAPRMAAIALALVNTLGLVWFAGELRPSTAVAGCTAVGCAFTVGLAPKRWLSEPVIRMAMLFLCALGIGALVLLILKDFQASFGVDKGAIILRLIFAAAFFFMARDIYSQRA